MVSPMGPRALPLLPSGIIFLHCPLPTARAFPCRHQLIFDHLGSAPEPGTRDQAQSPPGERHRRPTARTARREQQARDSVATGQGQRFPTEPPVHDIGHNDHLTDDAMMNGVGTTDPLRYPQAIEEER